MSKSFIFFGLIIVFSTVFAARVGADTLYLKNGRSIEGIVKQQNDNTVELEVDIGFVTFRKTEIERIESSSSAEIDRMRQKWHKKKINDEAERQLSANQERLKNELAPKEVKIKQESGHLVVSAVLNKNVNTALLVDTGASVMVLSKSIGNKLGLINKLNKPGAKENPTVELTVADGRKVSAQYVILQSVKVEEVEAEDVEAAILLEDNNAAVVFDGVLGMSFLKRFNFKFDNKQGKLTLEKIQ
jgi:clan AA aspartic protease (TIGR02281 family)